MELCVDRATWNPEEILVSPDGGTTIYVGTPILGTDGVGPLGVQDGAVAKFDSLWAAYLNLRLGTFQLPRTTDARNFTRKNLNLLRRLDDHDGLYPPEEVSMPVDQEVEARSIDIRDILLRLPESLKPRYLRPAPYNYQQGTLLGRLDGIQEIVVYQIFESGEHGYLWINRLNNAVWPYEKDIVIYGTIDLLLS